MKFYFKYCKNCEGYKNSYTRHYSNKWLSFICITCSAPVSCKVEDKDYRLIDNFVFVVSAVENEEDKLEMNENSSLRRCPYYFEHFVENEE